MFEHFSGNSIRSKLKRKLDTFAEISLRHLTIFESLKLILEVFKSCIGIVFGLERLTFKAIFK